MEKVIAAPLYDGSFCFIGDKLNPVVNFNGYNIKEPLIVSFIYRSDYSYVLRFKNSELKAASIFFEKVRE